MLKVSVWLYNVQEFATFIASLDFCPLHRPKPVTLSFSQKTRTELSSRETNDALQAPSSYIYLVAHYLAKSGLPKQVSYCMSCSIV